MSDKVSIPERAREIAREAHRDFCAFPEGYGHERDNTLCRAAVKVLQTHIESALRSERELCAKELEAEAVIARQHVKEFRELGMTDGYVIHAAINEVENFTRAAKLLRDGGQK